MFHVDPLGRGSHTWRTPLSALSTQRAADTENTIVRTYLHNRRLTETVSRQGNRALMTTLMAGGNDCLVDMFKSRIKQDRSMDEKLFYKVCWLSCTQCIYFSKEIRRDSTSPWKTTCIYNVCSVMMAPPEETAELTLTLLRLLQDLLCGPGWL